MKFCEDVDPENKIRCCASCHEDDEYGYPLIEKEIDGEEYEVCCAIARSLDLSLVESASLSSGQ